MANLRPPLPTFQTTFVYTDVKFHVARVQTRVGTFAYISLMYGRAGLRT